MSKLRILFLAYSLVIDDFTPLNIEGTSNGEMKPRVPKVAVEIASGFQLTLEWHEVFARYR